MDQSDLLSIRFVQGGVINDEKAVAEDDMLLCLVPEGRRVGVTAVKQAGQGIMCGTARLLRLDASGFGAGEDQRRSNDSVDVIEVGDFGLVHYTPIRYNLSPAELLTI